MLWNEASQRNQGLERAEALTLVEQIVEQHGHLSDTTDELITNATTNRERARAVLDTLRSTGWLQEDERSEPFRVKFYREN